MRIRTLTPDDTYHRVHSYFKGSPYHPGDRKLLYTRISTLDEPGQVCILDLDSGVEREIGEAADVAYHHGAMAYFADGGNKVIYQKVHDVQSNGTDKDRVACVDIQTGETAEFAGEVGPYMGNIDQRFLEVDADRPAEEQGEMGIYTRRIDGSDRRLLATVSDLLAQHPHGASIRQSQVLLRLGGEIAPDGATASLYLVTRFGTLVRDYYICKSDGSELSYHGRIGLHLMWHPNSREIVGYISPRHSSYYGQLRGFGSAWGYGYLGCYDTKTRVMRVLADYRLRGGPHLAPSPDGTKVAVDENTKEATMVHVYDFASDRMEQLLSEPRNLEQVRAEMGEHQDTSSSPLSSQHHAVRSPADIKKGHGYRVHAHAAFSHDSRRIAYNSTAGPRVAIREIEL